MIRLIRLLGVCALGFLVAGCPLGVLQAVNLRDFGRIGVVVFDDLVGRPDIAQGLTAQVVGRLIRDFDVVEVGDEPAVLAGLGAAALAPEVFVALGQRLGLVVVLTGTVTEAQVALTAQVSGGQLDVRRRGRLSLSYRLIDASSGTTLLSDVITEVEGPPSMVVEGQVSPPSEETVLATLSRIVARLVARAVQDLAETMLRASS